MPAKEKGRTVPLSDILEEEAEAAKRDAFPADDMFDPDRDLNFHGPGAFRRSMIDKDQMVIDELLASLPKNQGYYLKLYKEILPGKFELKESIEQYDTWTDMELEISNRVKAMTRKFGSKKWGSALYRVIVWKNGGIRERNKYPPIDVIVDAGDEVNSEDSMHKGKSDPLAEAAEQFAAFGGMLNAMKGIMPAAPDPNVQFQALAQAYSAGKGENANSGNMTMQMMTMMMTTMMTVMKEVMTVNRPATATAPEDAMAKLMGMLKDFHSVTVQPSTPQQTLAQQMAELKLLGIDPFKREDTIDQIAKLKAVMGSVTDLIPNGAKVERPGIMEKLIDTIGPIIPKIIGDLKTMTDNAALAQQIQAIRMQQTAEAAGAPPELGAPPPQRPMTRYGQPVGPQPNRSSHADAFREEPDYDPYSGFSTRPFPGQRSDAAMFGPDDFASPEQQRAAMTGQPVQPRPVAPQPVPQPAQQLPPLLVELRELIANDQRSAYEGLYNTLMGYPESRMMIEGILANMVTAQEMTSQLQAAGGPTFNEPAFVEKMLSYLDGFMQWVKAHGGGKVTAKCNRCQAMHTFESRAHFDSAERICAAEVGFGQTCGGNITIEK